MRQRSNGRAASARSLSIGALSRATEIPVETLRTWERRYGAPLPFRKPSGHRVYDSEMVDRLRLVRTLMDRGHRPGEILGLSAKELGALLRLTDSWQPAPTPGCGVGGLDRGLVVLFAGVVDLDRARLIGELRRQWAHMGPIPFLDELAGPFMADVGVAWHSGKLEVRHEHFAAACLSDFLREVREPFERRATGPRVVVSTLSGDRHEAGLLAVSVVLAMRGYRVAYLGADTPIDQIAAAVSRDIAAVAVSISSAVPRSRAAKAVALLRDALPRRAPLWIGGVGAPPPVTGVERFDSLAALDSRI